MPLATESLPLELASELFAALVAHGYSKRLIPLPLKLFSEMLNALRDKDHSMEFVEVPKDVLAEMCPLLNDYHFSINQTESAQIKTTEERTEKFAASYPPSTHDGNHPEKVSRVEQKETGHHTSHQSSPHSVQATDQTSQENSNRTRNEEAKETSYKEKDDELGIELRQNNATNFQMTTENVPKGQFNVPREENTTADDIGESSGYPAQIADEANEDHSTIEEVVHYSEAKVNNDPGDHAEKQINATQQNLDDQRMQGKPIHQKPEYTKRIPPAALWVSELPSSLFQDGPLVNSWSPCIIQGVERTWQAIKDERNNKAHFEPKDLEVNQAVYDKMIKELKEEGYISDAEDEENLNMLYKFLKTLLQKDYVRIIDIPAALANDKMTNATAPTNSRAEALKEEGPNSSGKQKRMQKGDVTMNHKASTPARLRTSHAEASNDRSISASHRQKQGGSKEKPGLARDNPNNNSDDQGNKDLYRSRSAAASNKRRDHSSQNDRKDVMSSTGWRQGASSHPNDPRYQNTGPPYGHRNGHRNDVFLPNFCKF